MVVVFASDIARHWLGDNNDIYDNLKYKYVCITTYQPNQTLNLILTVILTLTISTKQHAIVNILLNKVTCPTYPDEFIRDMLLHRLYDFRL